jgi:DNA-binding NarL/FixJ family response regulator
MTTLVLADDHGVMRQGLKALLETEKELTVVGEAADGVAAVTLVQKLKPDVLVVDLVMPGLSGLDVIREVRRSSPETRIVVLSMHGNEIYVQEALQNGALGYVLKQSNASELVRAIRTVAEGRRFLSEPISERVIDSYTRRSGQGTLDLLDTLTRREREVLRLVAEGLRSSEIAERLRIGVRTVESHRASLMHKLNLRNQAEVIRYALSRGLVPMEEKGPSGPAE